MGADTTPRCPQCGETLQWAPEVRLWDCGPPEEGGHGYWEPWAVDGSNGYRCPERHRLD